MATGLPVIFIVGPTASGKTGLAIKLAKEHGGEIICADSRTVYKDMNIGTAKPSASEQDGVVHWGLDLVEPGERFTAADFKIYAEQKIKEIRERGKIPFVVGGTGLYINGLLYDYQFDNTYDQSLRDALELMSVDALQDRCKNLNIRLPENSWNKRYLIRAIEKHQLSTVDNTQRVNSIIVGITTENNSELRRRIEERAEQLFENGVVEEAISLGKKYGWQSEAMTGNIYRIVKKYIDGDISIGQVKERFITSDWKLAKRQRTWFKRDANIRWLNLDDAYAYLNTVLTE